MQDLLILITAYLAGSVPTGVIVARALGAPDPRSQGSGNIGASNMWRVGGRRAGLLTFAGDVAKGALPVLFSQGLGAPEAIVGAAAFFAVLGHCHPITLGGRGGKGVATSLGVFLAMAPLAALTALAVFAVSVVATRMSSVGSLLACPALLAALPLTGAPPSHQVAAYAIVALVIWRHRENIGRLLAGQENRVGS